MSKTPKKPKQVGVSQLKKERAQKLVKLGMQAHHDKRLEIAEDYYRKSIEINPVNFQALYLLSAIATQALRYDDAIELCELAVKCNPGYALAHNDLGVMYQQSGKLTQAAECYKRALKLNPNFAEARNNMGIALQCQGDGQGALDYFRKAMEITPDYIDAHTNYIFSLDLTYGVTRQEQLATRRKLNILHMDHLYKESKLHTNSKETNRKLRLGYVSADLRLHSASFVFGAMLTGYDREKFEVFIYSNMIHKDDLRTQTFRGAVTGWRDINRVKDIDVVNMIVQDRIDVLIDLSGYSAGGRLPVFARKPAPVQITAWGYATSTSVKAMDAFFADKVTVPEDEQDSYLEKVVYLPNIVNHFCPEEKPDVGILPALTSKTITFGSFNRLPKLTKETFKLWGRVLNAIPHSRMILKLDDAGDTNSQKWALDNFAKVGVASDKISFIGKDVWFTHMGTYNQIDISLDPFPHGGGVTTLESLLMGVPVVTLRYPTIVGRLSASILTTLGMTDWIAETEDEYVMKAVDKSADLQKLSEVRSGLRDKLTSSVIGDCPTYVKSVEEQYTKLFGEWVERTS